VQLLPVLDIKGGVVVRGVGGRRAEYRPIVSRWTTSTRPLDVATALRTHFGLSLFYLADLDAIAGAAPALSLYAELRSHGFALWVDAGVRDADVGRLHESGVEGIVVGLETVEGPGVIGSLIRHLGADRVIFSLDLKEGQPLGRFSGWQSAAPFAIAAEAIALGVRQLIVLDLAQVGSNAGTGTEPLCRRLTVAFPEVAVTAGGGVRDDKDVQHLEQAGVKRVLVASALHDGTLSLRGQSGP
jgi:phosphoribosylformimino-5-aminoimidazole carboxamide ribotide isomerase